MKTVALAFAAAVFGVFGEESWKQEFTTETISNYDMKELWSDWKSSHSRGYPTIDEEAYRYEIWTANLDSIIESNNQDLPYKLKLNHFADLTHDEFRLKVHGRKGSCLNRKPKRFHTISTYRNVGEQASSVSDNPDSIDWTDYNGKSYVTPVKNQGDCGSCWAFSTTGSIECRYAIANDGELNSLSEQQLVDCSYPEGDLGCDGGLMDDGFKYVEKEGGLCSEDEYPYEAHDGICKASSCGTKYNAISSYSDVHSDSSTSLEDAAAQGCVSVAIEADQFAFQYYSSGVLTGNCGTSLDHGVLVVGYGTDNGQDYWKVKNSWGSSWGMDGYVLICRNCDKNGDKGECGILEQPSYPAV